MATLTAETTAAAATTSSSTVKRKSCNDWEKLNEESIRDRMSRVPAWTLVMEDGVPKLERQFMAKSFQACLDYITSAGKVAEERNHHPDLHLTGYRNCRIVIYSHGLSGLTDNDFDLAVAIDEQAKIEYSPKWLKENPLAAYTAKST